MVQLKSFKYTDDDRAPVYGGTSTSLPVDDQANTSISSQSAITVESVGGGNLTASSESDSLKLQRAETNRPSNESITTISSNEEYQTAHVDISDSGEDDSIATKLEVVSPTTPSGVPERGSIFPVPGGATPDIQRGHQSSPMISPLVAHRLQQQAKSISPVVLKRQWSGDNLSVGTTNVSNHFEIRWHDLNLFAKKSKLPNFITQNPFYKLLKNSDADAEGAQATPAAARNDRIYYSPPIGHKMIPPTISEDSELKTKRKPFGEQLSVPGSGPLQDQSAFLDQNAGDYRPILVNVSGSVFSGQLTAVLGPSGVGKTTLLDSLTGRNTLEGTGRVSLIGCPNRQRISVVTVPQVDVLPAKLSTLEDLQFTSRLKNPQSGFKHKRNIDRIVKLLQMEKFLYTRIEKLSGGEQRRLSIARELLSSPDILILDEPTSGLDANTCKRIITALRDIVEHSDNFLDRPMSIIVTIHQPQQEVLNLFHRVYVMAIGGCAIYEGPPTSLLSALVEQSSLSRVTPIEQLNDNPAIVAIEVASGEYGPNVIAELAMHHESQFYRDSIYNDEHGGYSGQSPFSTPRTINLRSPASGSKSPLSVSPGFMLLRRTQAKAGSPVPGSGTGPNDPFGSIGRPTPKLSKRAIQAQQFDKMSSITSISYASSYDTDLPEPVSKLKVDKRLRRSVVMKSSFLTHTWILMQRNWIITTRDLFLMAIRVIGFILVAGGAVQIYSHAIQPDQHQCPQFETEVEDIGTHMEAIKARLGSVGDMLRQANSQHTFFFHLVLCIVMVTSALTGLVFPLQMRMFVREYKNGWYSPASFTMSNTLSELPIDFIGPTLTILIIYPLCHQPASAYYFRELGYIGITIIASNLCKSQAHIIGAIFMDSIENSVFLSCVAVTLPALLSGIAVRVSQMTVPLQYASYGSFLRYAFECLFLLRYGFQLCPCDPEVVKGFPSRFATDTIPPQLDNLARGLIELNLPPNSTSLVERLSAPQFSESSTLLEYNNPVADNENLFTRFLHLVTAASNLFVPKPTDLGTCDKYRSLYLMDMGIPNDAFTKWVVIMLIMYVFSRFLTYFVVKAVIKMRRRG